MRNALGAIQSLLVLGGSSDIGAAIAERLVGTGCRTHRARRPPPRGDGAGRRAAAGRRGRGGGHAWDATDIAGHADAVKAAWAALPGSGGSATSTACCWRRACSATRTTWRTTPPPPPSWPRPTTPAPCRPCCTSAAASRSRATARSSCSARSPASGCAARTSSTARPRRALDGFCQGLGDSLAGTGVDVLVVRPGFVHTSMTEGKEAPPLSTTPEAVAEAVADGLAAGQAHGVGAGHVPLRHGRVPPPPPPPVAQAVRPDVRPRSR